MRHRLDQAARRHDVVLLELLGVESADLRVADDHHVASRHLFLPTVVGREIGLDDANVGMQPAQDRRVRLVLVDGDDVG